MQQMTSQSPINANSKLPWGWHFRPTPQELINNLKKKVKRHRRERVFESEGLSAVLREIDLSQIEPWEIKGIAETCSIRATHADELNQYFYTQKEQKYRHGKRANRATKGGFWKATGRDKPIFGRVDPRDKYKKIIGYRKALVFYEGRAPNGNKTHWILHEYRLESSGDSVTRDEQWVACHMFVKERNIQHKEPAQTVEFTSAEVLQKKQHNEWVDTVPQHQQSLSVKPEPGFLQSYPYMPALVSHPQHDQGDGLGLLRHEDDSIYSTHRTCPNDVTAHLARVTTGRVPYFDQIPRPAPGGRMLPSFDQVPRPLPGRQPGSSFEPERPLADVMFDMYAEQLQHSEGTLDNIW